MWGLKFEWVENTLKEELKTKVVLSFATFSKTLTMGKSSLKEKMFANGQKYCCKQPKNIFGMKVFCFYEFHTIASDECKWPQWWRILWIGKNLLSAN